MRKQLKKLLVVILIILTLNNFLMTASFASDPQDVDSRPAWVEGLIGLLSSFVALLTHPIRAIALGAAWGINLLTASIAYIEGTTEDIPEGTNTSIITPFDIFFNKVKILDIDFFDIGDDNSLVTQIRTSVAIWYYVLRNIAASILLVILIYVGIRMAISTVASDKAMYKKMLFDWVASLVLIFIIQYIIIFAITVNESILKAIEFGANSEEISNTYEVITTLAFDYTDLDSVAATVIFCMLVWQTLGLVISYFNRMLKLAFLIIISPLITLTYSIDKMGDGKAQALGAWLKEFVYTILIQPFHCIIYMCFVNVAFNLLIKNAQGDSNNSTLGVAVVAILSVRFVKEAEKLIRKIFSFKDDNSSTSMTAGLAMAGVALSQSKNLGRGARNAFNGMRTTKGAFSSAITGAKVGALAIGAKLSDPSKSFAEHKSDVRTDINNKKAEKIEAKYSNKKKGDKYTVSRQNRLLARAKQIKKESNGAITSAKALEMAREEEVAEIKKAAPGISDKEAQSIARLNSAKRDRNEKGAVRKHITKAKGRINKAKDIISHSDTLKTVGAMAKGTLSSGMGLMVGSGIYGTNGNLATAIAGGAAMFRGTQEFQRTASTLEAGVEDNLRGLGVKGQSGAAAEISHILNNSNLYADGDESTEAMKALLDKVGEALKRAGVDSKYKTHVKNSIENGIKANPAETSRIVRDALNSLNYKGSRDPLYKDKYDGDKGPGTTSLTGVANNSKQTPLTEVNNGELLRATQDLADFVNRKQIYKQIQTAGEFNIDSDTFAGDVISRFNDVGDDRTTTRIVHSTEESVEDVTKTYDTVSYKRDIRYMDDEIENITNAQLKELDADYQRRIKEAKREAENPNLSIDEKRNADAAVRRLEQEQATIIARALANSDRDLSTISKKMLDRYEEKLKVAIEQVTNEIRTEQAKASPNDRKIKILNNRLDRMNETLNGSSESESKIEGIKNRRKGMFS